MKNKLKSAIALSIFVLCSGCEALNYPYEWANYTQNGRKSWKHKSLESQVKQDMLACGFVNATDNQGLITHDDYIEASLCMEKKGYMKETLPKGVCHRYPDSSPCQNKPTGGNNSEGTSTLGEWKNMFGNPATVHSCYGVGNEKCSIKNYWDDSIPKNGQGINNTDLPKWQPIHQPSPKINNNQGE